jgi:hypothetical protein
VSWLFSLAALLVLIGWLGYRRRLEELRGSSLTDDDIREIEARGRLPRGEPLDLEEAAEEEERFWGESWDEPEQL